MTYEFTEIKSQSHYTGIHVGKTYANISKALYELMGKPLFVSIFVDRSSPVIALKPNSSSGYKLKVGAKGFCTVQCYGLNKKKPQGRYELVEEITEGMYVCRLVEPN